MTRPEPRRDFHVVDAVAVPRWSRLKTGFHRLGLAAAGLLFPLTILLFASGIKVDRPLDLAQAWMLIICIAGVISTLVYAAFRLTAWIFAGFLGAGR